MNAPTPRLSSPTWRTSTVVTTAREVQVQKFRVEVVNGPNRGQVATAEADELSVGTAATNQLVLTDSTVSRHHLSIAATPDGFQLRDLGSTSGTCLAGYRVEVAYIDSGALIQAGDSTIRFDALEDRLSQPLGERDRFGDVLGQSAAMRRAFALLERVAASDTCILLEGESGTGKRALAQAIHRQSARAAGPFVIVDCASMPPALLESELFGHEPASNGGADAGDTGAGAFGAAEGGTLFLDEVGDLGPDLQTKLLRALESRQIRRIGSVAPVAVGVRVIAATSRDLRPEVNAGGLRTDLLHRLGAMRVTVPALRERKDDIPLLVAHFYRQGMRDPNAVAPGELVTTLVRQPWPGNVRELRGAVERALLLDQPAATESNDPAQAQTWPALDFTVSFRESKESALAVWTRIYVRELVDRYGGNLSRAARAVSMDRNHLRDLLHKYAMNGNGQQ